MKSRLLPVFGLVLALGLPVKAAADQSLSLRLFIATAQDDAATISRLLASGADPNNKAKGYITPLHIAAKLGHASAIDALLVGGANPNAKNIVDQIGYFSIGGYTPLHFAAQRGHHEAIESLLAGGADPNVKAAGRRTTPLYEAAYGHLSAVKALLAGGADPNVNEGGFTPLYRAAEKLNFGIMSALLAAGADSNVKAGADGDMTPLDKLIDSLEELP